MTTLVANENALETALRRAVSDAAARPDFYRALLDADLLVIGHAEVGSDGMLVAGSKAELQHWQRNDGTPILPVFSSLDALQRAIDEDGSYLKLQARALFEMTRGATLVLNPRNDFGKELTPEEIASLLDHGIGHAPTRRTIERETQVLLGQPSDYPHAMVDAVSRYAKDHPEIVSASLALMKEPGDSEARIVLGVALEDGVDEAREAQILQPVGVVASEAMREQRPDFVVDLVRVMPGEEGLSRHFRESVRPFYSRGFLAGLKRRLAL